MKRREPPRLSNALRLLTNLSRKSNNCLANNTPEVIAHNKKLRLETSLSRQLLTWEKLLQIVEPLKQSDPLIEKSFKQLRDVVEEARKTEGAENSLSVEEGVAFVVDLFANHEGLGFFEEMEIRTRFGWVAKPLYSQIYSTVMAFFQLLSEAKRKQLISLCYLDRNKGYGWNFTPEEQEDLHDPEEDERQIKLLFNIFPDHLTKKMEALKPNNKPVVNGDITKERYDRKWLEKEVKEACEMTNYSALPSSELCTTIINLLQSSRSNDALQNDLFDLLGFDFFDVIQQILEHRNEVVNSLKNTSTSNAVAAVPILLDEKRPTYGCQVIVQSEEEKQVRKLVRKEEKKFMKAFQKDPEREENEFDAEALRASRESALLSAVQKPLFQERSNRAPKAEKFPFVFDAFADAQKAAGFIGGKKLLLPVGCTRRETKEYEEMKIPAPGAVPTGINTELIRIEDMDQIGQKVFSGCKTLNRIQSIVYEAAYFSNENLLVSAPTGAGKTNVAMLTVLHQIKQHIQEGVIQTDKFKIVYVAPMKALAAEMTKTFGSRLLPLGISVKELTGDMQLTKTEILQTQMIVTTPEKWDVITRKPGDVSLSQLVKLLIIDEVHLLHGDRGPVVEALVARTLRQVESSQSMIRIVGLSATLPNYVDVARFLNVNLYKGLFYFDTRFRPVPLEHNFVGVKAVNPAKFMKDMDDICYDKVAGLVDQKHQVMVFVHARNATVKTAMMLKETAQTRGHSRMFLPDEGPQLGLAQKMMSKSRNAKLKMLFDFGFATHHAGMLRADRTLVEKLFSDGIIKVLVCTATLAWGVNLPAHAVIIKGTEIYDAKHGAFVDLGLLDVQQIFGRAGRPQFDKSGEGFILTSHDKLPYYLSLLTCQYPIESSIVNMLVDNLNAEISLGTVTNVDEAVTWLSYTYLYIRMRRNPQVYGIKYQELQDDPFLTKHRHDLICSAARSLDKAKMIRFDEKNGYLHPTDLGRTASHFYIKYDTVETFNELLNATIADDAILSLVSKSAEFNQIKVRDDELEELDRHRVESCWLGVLGGSENSYGKVNILLQAFISKSRVDSFSLVSDMSYVAQNAARIMRALFEIALKKNWSLVAGRLLKWSKVLERQIWDHETPLKQFDNLSYDILRKIEERNLTVDKIKEMDCIELGHFIWHQKMGKEVKKCAEWLPKLDLDASIQPITRTVLRVTLTIKPEFTWNDRIHGKTGESFWVWVEDSDTNYMYHSEHFMISRKQVAREEVQKLVFTIPIFDPLPSQYYVRVISDRWLGCEDSTAISFKHLILPERHPPHTELLDLMPMSIKALKNPKMEQLYNYTHFNPIQTQLFHCLYHTDSNVLLGAPTGSGKTVAAEIAMFRVFKHYPEGKVIYIAPMKALVRERIKDWKVRLGNGLHKNVVELTGDVSPDVRAIQAADVIVTTPEKWDGISRSWLTRNYVQKVSLIIIDEIHLLGEDRGPVLEVIVSRTNYIAAHTKKAVRIIGLSTALANAQDLAEWLSINNIGLYNFRPIVRPVPMEVHINGFPGKHYCPRMATMNKPIYQAICSYSEQKPSLVFVASRRQTRLTALDLISFLASDEVPKKWLHMAEEEMENQLIEVRDANLKLTLAFGVGLHHAGLHERDRKIVEELFVNQKIQVLITTATLAWGVNFPAHLVVVKGTEYYDGKSKRYVDFPITDVLQMIGRAGRPQYDDHGVAVVLVHDVKKHYYKKFLYEPFPVESSLLNVLPDHLNAEIVAGTIASKRDALDYITWTFFFRRLLQNPTYYGLEDIQEKDINGYLTNLVLRTVNTLVQSSCLVEDECGQALEPTVLGRIASYYYLSHETLCMFKDNLHSNSSLEDLLRLLCNATEYNELPVRHNEDLLNADLAKLCPMKVDEYSYDDPHVKTHLLLQAHFSRLQLPCSDYLTDLKSVLDQAMRILQGLLDVAANFGYLATSLRIQLLMQMVTQGQWLDDPSVLTLPYLNKQNIFCLRDAQSRRQYWHLEELRHFVGDRYEKLAKMLRSGDSLQEPEIHKVYDALQKFPDVHVRLYLKGEDEMKELVTPEKGVSEYVSVYANKSYDLCIKMFSRNRKKQDRYAFAPKFPKPKSEGWFFVLGDIESGGLLCMKRGVVRDRSFQHLGFTAPSKTGLLIYTVYIISDCYLGFDMQYDVALNVVPAPPEEVTSDNEECVYEKVTTCPEEFKDSDSRDKILGILGSGGQESNNKGARGKRNAKKERHNVER